MQSAQSSRERKEDENWKKEKMRGETFLQKSFSPHPSSKNSQMAGGGIGGSMRLDRLSLPAPVATGVPAGRLSLQGPIGGTGVSPADSE